MNKIKELHNNIRHITQLGMNWFAFFVTVNYLTMGWLAKGPRNESPDPRIVSIVAMVFIVQNVLGIFGLSWVLVAATAMKNEIIRLNPDPNADSDSQKEKSKYENIPDPLYKLIGGCLCIVLFLLIYAWIRISCVISLSNNCFCRITY